MLTTEAAVLLLTPEATGAERWGDDIAAIGGPGRRRRHGRGYRQAAWRRPMRPHYNL
jgi:hypothetical protein